VLVEALNRGERRVLLQQGILYLPSVGNSRASRLTCAALATVGGEYGLRIEVQSRATPAVVGATLSGGGGARKPYVLRGRDADGGRWQIKDGNLQSSSCRFTTGGASFELAPVFTHVRSDHVAEHQTHLIEIAVAARACLPDFEIDVAASTRKKCEGKGSYADGEIDIRHRVVGDFRVISMRRLDGIRPYDQALRLIDALSFVNGFEVWPRLIRRIERDEAVLTIYRSRDDWDTQALSPFDMKSFGGGAGAWAAVAAYCRFCSPAKARSRPVVSRCVSQLQGSYGSLFLSNKTLAAAIAVEGLVSRFVRKDIVKIWPNSKRSKWKQWVDAAALPLDVANRLKNAIGDTKRRTTGSLLRTLRDRTVIPANLVDVWTKQRPRHAHSVRGSDEAELESFFASVSLFQAIVLSLIDYKGDHRTFGSNGRATSVSCTGRPPATFNSNR